MTRVSKTRHPDIATIGPTREEVRPKVLIYGERVKMWQFTLYSGRKNRWKQNPLGERARRRDCQLMKRKNEQELTFGARSFLIGQLF